jgi:hypothetical protein
LDAVDQLIHRFARDLQQRPRRDVTKLGELLGVIDDFVVKGPAIANVPPRAGFGGPGQRANICGGGLLPHFPEPSGPGKIN